MNSVERLGRGEAFERFDAETELSDGECALVAKAALSKLIKLRAELAMSPDGGPALFFFDTAGRNRLVLGLYSPAEGEAPSVVLNDAQQRAAGIFRLFGSRDTPVVVLKSQGRDRSVYGLNPGSTEPFLANYSGDGTKSDVFGHY